MEDETLGHVEAKTLYIVHIKGHRGTCSIAFKEPARALKSVSDLLRHGFSEVRISDAAGETLAIEDIRLRAGQ